MGGKGQGDSSDTEEARAGRDLNQIALQLWVLMDQDTQPQDDSQSFDLDDSEDMHLDRLHTILLQLLTQLRQDRAIVTSELANAINSLRDAVQTYQIDVADVQVCKLEEQVFLLGRHVAGIKTQLNKLSGLIIRLSNALDRAQIFKGEGATVERDAEVWLEAMDAYFEATGTHPQNQMMLAMFKLTENAKIWWKMHCRDSDIIGTSQSWEEIKNAITMRYLPPAHKATKMNEFFSLRQLSFTLEEYYSKFVTLQRYAPKMTLEQQVTSFCQGLIEPLDNKLKALRPTTLQNTLLRAKPLAKEIKETTQGTIIPG
ncbi:hypothetical protein L7F22_045600 [Adiantum nelumboides]|nr:hypothetical protein [Adiantum nelumboides]